MTSNSRTVNSAKNVGIGAFTQVILLFLSFISRTVFVKLLGNEYLSVNGLFTNILTLISFTELGIGSAIIFSFYSPLACDDKDKVGRLINFFAIAYRYIAITITLLGLLVLPFINSIVTDVPNVKGNIILLYCLFLANTVFSYVWGYKKSLLIADQKNYIVTIINLSVNFLQVIGQITILILSRNFLLFLLVMIICTILNNIISTQYVNRKYSWLRKYEHFKLDKYERKSIFSNVKAIIIYKLGSVILNGTDNIIISTFLKTTLIGICSNYVMIITSVGGIINQGIAGLTASIGNYNVKAKAEENEKIFNQLNLIFFWIFGLISVLFGCLLTPFVQIWLGCNYILRESVVITLILGFYVTAINSIPSSYRTSMGFFKQARFAPFLASIINVLLSIIGARYWGLEGVFMATFIAKISTYNIVDPYFIYKKGFGKSPKTYYLSFVYRFVLIIITYLICRYIISLLSLSGVGGLFVNALIILCVFNVIFGLVFIKDKAFNDVILKVRSLKNKIME